MTRSIAIAIALAGVVLVQVGCDSSGAADNGKKSPSASAKASKPSAKSAAQSSATQTPVQAAPAASRSVPVWQADETSFNFGDLWAGPQASLQHTFTFQNGGTETLRILNAKPKCGCTVAEGYSTTVPPGETGTIPLTLNARNFQAGWVSKTVDVTTNDPQRPLVVLELKGNIKTLCSFTPPDGTLFHRARPNERLYREVTVRSNVDYPLSLEMQPLSANSFFQINWEEVVPGKEWRYTALAEPPHPEGKSGATQMLFRTNCPEVPLYEIYASCYVVHRVEVLPSKLVLPKVASTTTTRTITISNNGNTPFELVSIMTSEPRLSPTLLPADARTPNEYKIQCTIPAGYEPPPYGEMIEIKTTDYEKGVIEIPVLTMATYRNPLPRPADKPLNMVPGDMSAAGVR